MIGELKKFILRSIFILKVIARKKQEPFFKWNYILRYWFNGYYFPSFRKQNLKNEMQLQVSKEEKYVLFRGIKINYPMNWNNELIKDNFNNIMNEQTRVGESSNPHKYLLNRKLQPDWVVYDLGAAEGSQSKFWAKEVKQLVLFEPAPSFFTLLQKTFEQEVSDKKVILINAGVTAKKCSIRIEDQEIEFDTLEAFIKKYNLPIPNYIKADIEGEELAFLKSSETLLKTAPVKLVEITSYHRPDDYIKIPEFFKQFKGNSSFSEGVLIFNRNGLTDGGLKQLYSPVIRKCLYSFEFDR